MGAGVFFAVVVVAGVLIYLICVPLERERDRYRMHCGECRFRTQWLPVTAAEDTMLRHYGDRHGGVEPGGLAEVW